MRGRPIFTETKVSNLCNAACGASLVRGNTFDHCWGDLINDADVNVGNRVDDFSSMDYRSEVAALTVNYSGSEATASLAVSGLNGRSRTIIAKFGNDSNTFMIDPNYDIGIKNNNYTIQHVANWLNTLPGWSAKVLDNSRQACCIQKKGTAGEWGDTNVKDTMLTLYTMFDIHGDFSQTWNKENYVISDNIVTNSVCQNIFMANGFSRDAIIINNSFHNLETDNQFSQLASDHSHVVISHNSSSKQGWWFRGDVTYNPDGYCLFSNNVAPSINWMGSITGNLKIRDNHLFNGGTIPSGSTGTSMGGNSGNLFSNPALGEFLPRGELLANLKRPCVIPDISRKYRLDLDAVGSTKKNNDP